MEDADTEQATLQTLSGRNGSDGKHRRETGSEEAVPGGDKGTAGDNDTGPAKRTRERNEAGRNGRFNRFN